jgi:YD repeat-containing protein
METFVSPPLLAWVPLPGQTVTARRFPILPRANTKHWLYAVDREGVLWSVERDEDTRVNNCATKRVRTWRLRAYDKTGRTLLDKDIDGEVWTPENIHVTDFPRAGGANQRQVMLTGGVASPFCHAMRLHYTKSFSSFTDDEDDLTRCPRRYEDACRQSSALCPCKSCNDRWLGDCDGVTHTLLHDVTTTAHGTLVLTPVGGLAHGNVQRYVPDGRGALLAGNGVFMAPGNPAGLPAGVLVPPLEPGIIPVLDTPSGDEPPRWLGSRKSYYHDNTSAGIVLGQSGGLSPYRGIIRTRSPGNIHVAGGGQLVIWSALGERGEDRLVMQLLVPAAAHHGGMEMEWPPVDQGITVVNPSSHELPPLGDFCTPVEVCRTLSGYELGLADERTCAEPLYQSFHQEARCTVSTRYQRCPVVLNECDPAIMRAEYEAGLPRQGCGVSTTSYSRSWLTAERGNSTAFIMRCAPDAVEIKDTASTGWTQACGDSATVTRTLRCRHFNQTWVPGSMHLQLSPVSDVIHPSLTVFTPQCGDIASLPARLVVVDARDLPISVEGPDGPGDTVVAPGESVVVSSGLDADYTGTVTVSGTGTLPGNASEATLTDSSDVVVTATDAGVMVIRVTVTHRNGGRGTRTIFVFVEGDSTCRADAEDRFRTCGVAAPFPVRADAEQESRLSPARSAGGSVLLHDMSFTTSATDLSVSSVTGAFQLGRTYRSSVEMESGGVMGGWTFSWDERLVPTGVEQGPEDVCLELPSSQLPSLAYFDGTGRVDVFAPPETVDRVTFVAGGQDQATTYARWDHAAAQAVAKPFTAEVANYQRPRGRFESFRAFTLVTVEGQSPSEVHPWYREGASAVGPDDARFFELTSPDGIRRVFNCRGQLIRIVDPRLQEIELVYDGGYNSLTRSPQLSKVVDFNGRQYNVAWAEAGLSGQRHARVASVTDPFGRRVEYRYVTQPGRGVLLSDVTLRLPGEGEGPATVRTTRYRYDMAGRVVESTAPDSLSVARVEYDGNGKVTSVEYGKPGGTGLTADTATWRFSASGNQVDVTDPTGKVVAVELSALADGGPRVVTRQRVSVDVFDGNVAEPGWTPAQATTSWLHDADGLVLEQTHPSGKTETLAWNDKGAMLSRQETPPGSGVPRRWEYEVDGRCQVRTRERTPDGAVTNFELGAFSLASPGENCRVLHAILPLVPDLATGTIRYTDEYEYHVTGVLRGTMKAERRLGGLPGSLVLRQSLYTHHDDVSCAPTGNPSPAGRRAVVKLGYLTRQVDSGRNDPACTETQPTSFTRDFEVDDRGNTVRDTTRRASGDLVLAHVHDLFDRRASTEILTESLPTKVTFQYDQRGRLTRSSQTAPDHFTHDHVPAQLGVTVSWQTFYDALDRPVGRVRGDGQVVEVRGFDGMGRLVRLLRTGPGASGADLAALVAELRGGTSVASILMDPRFDVTQQPYNMEPTTAGPRFILETMTHDGGGRLKTHVVSDGNTNADDVPFLRTVERRFFLDLDGNVRVANPGRTDRQGILVETTWSGLGDELTRRVWDPGCPAGTPLVEERVDSVDGWGRPTRVSTWGSDGAPDAVTGPLGIACGTAPRKLVESQFQYDGLGNVVQEVETGFPLGSGLTDSHPAQYVVTADYAYDGLGHVARTERSAADSGKATEETVHTWWGETCKRKHAVSGSTVHDVTLRGFDSAGLLTVERLRHHVDQDVSVDAVEQFEHDALRRLVRRTDASGNAWRTMYDAAGRTRATEEPNGLLRVNVFDNAGRVVEQSERAEGAAPRVLALAWGGEYLVDETRSEVVQESRGWGYDVLGNPALVFPYGRGHPTLRVQRWHTPTGEVHKEVLTSGVVKVISLDAAGRPVRVTGTPPESNRDQGYENAVALVKEFTYDGLGQVTRAVTATAAGAPLTTVEMRWSSLNGLLEELQIIHTPEFGPERIVRSKHNGLGHPTALFHPGAERDLPDVTYQVDAVGRVDAVGLPAGARAQPLFPGVDGVAYQRAGGLVVRRSTTGIVEGSGGAVNTVYEFDEAARRVAMQHHRQGFGEEGLAWYESRNYFHKGMIAATMTSPLALGAPQGDVRGSLNAMRVAGSSSHLASYPDIRTLPAGSSFLTPGVSPHGRSGEPQAALFKLMSRDPFGDVLTSQSITYQPSSGNASVDFEWRDREGWRLRNVQTLTWAPGDTLETGSSVLLRNARFQPCRATGAAHHGERPGRACHGMQLSPEGALHAFPQTSVLTACGDPDPVGVYRESYDAVYNKAGLLYRLGADDYEYDVFDRLVRARSGGLSGDDTVNQARVMHVVYDALDRPVGEHYEYEDDEGNPATGSDMASERKHRRVFWRGDVLEEEEWGAGGIVLRTAMLLGGDDDVPAVRTPDGTFLVMEDMGGSFIGFLDLVNAHLRVKEHVTASNTGLRPQAVLVDPAASGWWSDLTQWLSGARPEHVFRRVSRAEEQVSFMRGASLSVAGGLQVDLTSNPDFQEHYALLDSERFHRVVAMQAALVAVLLFAPYLAGAVLGPLAGATVALAMDVIFIATDLAMLGYSLYQHGFTAEALVYAASAALAALGLRGSVNMVREARAARAAVKAARTSRGRDVRMGHGTPDGPPLGSTPVVEADYAGYVAALEREARQLGLKMDIRLDSEDWFAEVVGDVVRVRANTRSGAGLFEELRHAEQHMNAYRVLRRMPGNAGKTAEEIAHAHVHGRVEFIKLRKEAAAKRFAVERMRRMGKLQRVDEEDQFNALVGYVFQFEGAVSKQQMQHVFGMDDHWRRWRAGKMPPVAGLVGL